MNLIAFQIFFVTCRFVERIQRCESFFMGLSRDYAMPDDFGISINTTLKCHN